MAENPSAPILTVSEFLSASRTLLEDRFPQVSVRGEITNLKVASSGHMYLSLKDEKGRVDCAFFRGYNQALAFKPVDGLQVVVGGTATLYEARGQFQLTLRWMEPLGLGGLQLAFEQLRQRLSAEGLFEASRKRPLPAFPQRVAVVTSAEGAAWKDFLRILETRVGIEEVDLFDVRVQGAEATRDIVDAFQRIADWPEYDVVVLTRGGGSAEDLSAFNQEAVVRAVAACPVPVMCAVGHEIDTTLCDFAADKRAPTPTAAAEWVAPGREEMEDRLRELARRLTVSMRRALEEGQDSVGDLAERLAEGHPSGRLDEMRRRVDELSEDLGLAFKNGRVSLRERFSKAAALLARTRPLDRSHALRERLGIEDKGLRRNLSLIVRDASSRLRALEGRLEAARPDAPLKRGYAWVTRASNGELLRSAEEVAVGEALRIRLARGSVDADVTGKDEGR